MIAGIFLAAGRSARFGANKLLQEIRGKPLLYYGLRSCLRSSLPEIGVVVGDPADRLERSIRHLFPGEKRIRIVRNRHADRGLMSSVKAGLRVVDSQYDAAMIILGDMPRVTPEIIDSLASAFAETNAVVIPECAGRLHHPRVIPRRLFGRFLALRNEESGADLIRAIDEEIVRVPVGVEADYVDVDTPEDLDALTE